MSSDHILIAYIEGLFRAKQTWIKVLRLDPHQPERQDGDLSAS